VRKTRDRRLRAAALSALILALPAVSNPAGALVVCCAGDSLMRPIPAHFRALAPASGLLLEIREWAQGGLNTETYPSFYRRLLPDWEGKACDAILLQLGTNDAIPLLEKRWGAAEFRDRMTGILAEFKKYPGQKRPRPVLFLATVPLFCDRPESEARNRIVETVINPLIRDIARAEGAVLVDNAAVINHRPALYDQDCVHPAPEGEKALALNWLAALGRVFPDEIAKPPLRPGDRP
jgi:lysophospholipase L1-like esterase